jgi:diphthamide biosynthesis methyltransferase
MFYVIGLGLSDEKDITVKGLEVCQTAATIE